MAEKEAMMFGSGVNEICLPVSWLNGGSKSQTIRTAKTMASKVSIIDSDRNCKMSCLRLAPTTFFIPTSFIRLEAFAVERFMKLMQAITKIKMAIRENNLT